MTRPKASEAVPNKFWQEMNEASRMSRASADWQKAGINLNPKHFETFAK